MPELLPQVGRRAIIIGIVLAFAAGAVVLWRSDHQPPALPPALATRVESLTITRPLDSARIDSLRRAAAVSGQAARAAAARAATIEASAAQLQQRADSLAQIAAQRDSAAAWRVAYLARTEQADSLHAANDSLHAAIHQLAADTLAQALHIASLERRNRSLEALNADLVRATARAGQCRLVGPIPCPSRGAVAVTTIVVLESARFALGKP